jgi:ATP-dependent DNA helicase PIF1
MRLKSDSTDKAQHELKEFADWILKIGDGKMDQDENGEAKINIPEELCVQDVDKPLMSLVDFVYPNIVANIGNFINDFVLDIIPGDFKDYLSCDTPCKSDEEHEIQSNWFTSGFLNDIWDTESSVNT